MRVVDVSDPTAPFESGFYNTPSNAFGVAAVEPYVFVVDAGSGLQIYEHLPVGVEESQKRESTQPRVRLLRNPVWHDGIQIELTVMHVECIRLGLYNLIGQQVALSEYRPSSPGRHEVSISTRDIANGVYFLRLDGMPDAQSAKVVVLK
jgi:hypothetical protein